MSTDSCLQFRQVGIIVLLGVSATSSCRAACYSTPRIAANALVTTSSFFADMKNDGYQVMRIESDPVLGKKWAMVSRCGHTDWPVLAVLTNETNSFTAASVTESDRTAPVVHAGDAVRLWKQESMLRFELSGVAEESGRLGTTIRVRLAHKNTDGQSISEELSGIIRGQSNVEILP
jgi:hypothetical protein